MSDFNMLHENDMSFMFKSRSVSRCRSFLIINEQLTREGPWAKKSTST
jgi:hypothetical protein